MSFLHSFIPSVIGIMVSVTLIVACSNKTDEPVLPVSTIEANFTTNGSKDVSIAEATAVANAFDVARFGTPGILNRGTQELQRVTNNDGKVIAYVVNNSDGGWVIVSATKNYYPILAYSDNQDGKFDIESGMRDTGMSVWLGEISAAIGATSSFDEATSAAIANEWSVFEKQSTASTFANGLPGGNSPEAVKCRERLKELNETYYKDGWTFKVLSNVTEVAIPSEIYSTADYLGSQYQYTIIGLKDESVTTTVNAMVTTEWHQKGYGSSQGPSAGCVPIAMGQIMYYHRFPTHFRWNQMPNYFYNYTFGSAILELITDIREKLGMGQNDTGSNPGEAISAFNKYGYYATQKDHTSQDVIHQLAIGHPVMMFGTDKNTGGNHSWVCDGYTHHISEYRFYAEFLNSVNEYTNYGITLMENPGSCSGISYTTFHMNWGWGIPDSGDVNGWYLTPTPQNHDYSKDRKNVYVYPL